jgi:polyferredoxin
MASIPWLSILALGWFVGFLIERGLQNSGPTMRAAITALGAALGSGPVLFLSGLPEGHEFVRWIYPIGLVLGVAWPRVSRARHEITEAKRRPSKSQKLSRRFAWLDTIVIVAATLAAMIYAALKP